MANRINLAQNYIRNAISESLLPLVLMSLSVELRGNGS